MKFNLFAAAMSAIAMAQGAAAQEIGGGIGASWRFEDGNAVVAFDLDATSQALWSWRGLSAAVGAGGEIDTDGALWGGVGPVLHLDVTERVRLEGSVMVGLYDEGNGVDLGGPVNFRSRVGVSYAVAPQWRLGIALSHKSNAGFYTNNPGVERLVTQVSYAF